MVSRQSAATLQMILKNKTITYELRQFLEIKQDQEYRLCILRIQCSLNKFELSATTMTNPSLDHNTSASKTVGQRPSLKRSENRDSSLKRMCCQV